MRNILKLTIGAGLLVIAGGAFAQTAPKQTFEVASVKPAAPLDMTKLAAAMKNGEAPKIGMHVDGGRVEFTYVDLKTLIGTAYKVKPYQITGPDWLATQRFDIVAKFPTGATREDIPQMLQALLEERFKLAAHRESKENPVLALVVGKGGPKLVKSTEVPKAIDESAPLKPGQMKMDGPDGPMLMTVDPKTGGGTMDMGAKGSVTFKVDTGDKKDVSTMSMHMAFSQVTMEGFADTLTQFFSQMSRGTGRTVKDFTELKGNYEASLDIAMSDLMSMAQAQGMNVGGGAGGGAASADPGAVAASDPSGGSTLSSAVQALGLKLEQRKAVLEQLVVDHTEKVPTEN